MVLAGMCEAMRVLIADDDADMRSYLRDVLQKRGFSIAAVASGCELLARLAHDEPYDLVVSDLRMPSPSGLQVACMMRTAGLATPFLLITAFPDARLQRALAALPSVTLLGKPFTPAQLVSAATALTKR